MEQKIVELQAQITELKELVGVRPEPEKPKKLRTTVTRHWEGIPEVKTDSEKEPVSQSVSEPEKDLMTRVSELENDVRTIKEQVKTIFHEFERVQTDIQSLKRHHPFSF